MVDAAVIVGRCAVAVEQGQLLNLKSRLAAPAAGKQKQADGAVRPVAHQAQALRLQTCGAGFKADLGQPFGLVDQEEIAAPLERPGRCGKEVL